MKKVVIVHCWEGYPNYCWYPNTKKELEDKGFKVEVPEMPETDLPKLTGWLLKLQEVIGKPDEDLYLVGHSLGVITILRYLESLPDGTKIGGAVFVAGFTNDLGYTELKNFFKKPVDLVKARNHCTKFVAIHSDNDPYVSLDFGNEFQEKLDAKLIIKHKMGHFSGPVDDEKSCKQLPEVVASVLELSS
jgi:hypothetical protein